MGVDPVHDPESVVSVWPLAAVPLIWGFVWLAGAACGPAAPVTGSRRVVTAAASTAVSAVPRPRPKPLVEMSLLLVIGPSIPPIECTSERERRLVRACVLHHRSYETAMKGDSAFVRSTSALREAFRRRR
jgi:hypothetical protein